MTALVLKDLRLLRPWWWLVVPGHALFSANGIVSPETFFVINGALALAYTLGLIIVEWKQDAERFVGSLPVSRGDMVRARYAGALGAAVCGTVLYGVYGSALLALGTERLLARWPDTPPWQSAGGLTAFFLTVWLISVAYLPFYFRAGLAKGTWLFVLSLAPVIVTTASLIQWQWLPWSLAEVSEAAGPVVTVIAAFVLAGVGGWTSLVLAVRSYRARDL